MPNYFFFFFLSQSLCFAGISHLHSKLLAVTFAFSSQTKERRGEGGVGKKIARQAHQKKRQKDGRALREEEEIESTQTHAHPVANQRGEGDVRQTSVLDKGISSKRYLLICTMLSIKCRLKRL